MRWASKLLRFSLAGPVFAGFRAPEHALQPAAHRGAVLSCCAGNNAAAARCCQARSDLPPQACFSAFALARKLRNSGVSHFTALS